MEELKRIRKARGLSQAKLAALADLDPSTVSQIETGTRHANTRTLERLAAALGIEVVDLFPKGERRSSLEPKLFNGLEDERLSETVEAIFGLMERWHARRLAEVEDEASPHFRDPTSAALWIADTREEAQDFCEWLGEYVENHLEIIRSVRDIVQILAAAVALDGPAELGSIRLREMAEKPDELAARRLERATTQAQASMKRLQGLGKVANG